MFSYPGGIAAVRKRPGMYVGDTGDGTGLHKLLDEVVGNAINEAAAGHGRNIFVRLNPDGSCSVRDNGRGIPVDRHPELGISVPEVMMTALHSGAGIERPYQGIGLCPVNALSDWLDLRVWRNGAEYYIRFVDGVLASPLRRVGDSEGKRGTELTFKPSQSFFTTVEFDAPLLQRRMGELSAAHGVTIQFDDQR